MAFALKICGAVGTIVLVVASKLGSARLLTATASWQIGPSTHLWVVEASSHLGSCILKDFLFAMFLLMFLLLWDLLEACPQTLALASACSRNSTLIRSLVFLRWCKLSFHSVAMEHLTMEGGNQQTMNRWTAKMLRRKLLSWMLWSILSLVLSTLPILYQTSRSIPGFLPAARPIMSLALKACIGAIQGLVGSLIVPYLANKITQQKHMFTTLSNLLMNFLIPAVVIMCLDTGCLGRWVSLWNPCQRSNSQMFQRRLICTTERDRDCDVGLPRFLDIDIIIQSSSDICDPHFSWSSASISSCIHTVLFRLQEIWLTKFLMTGLAMQGMALLRDGLPTESGEVVGNFGILIAYAMLSSGHLPLMNFVLLLTFFSQGLVARVAWAKSRLNAKYVENVAAPVVKIARLLSLMVYLASAAREPCTLAAQCFISGDFKGCDLN